MDIVDTYNITDEALEKLSSSQLEQITNDYFDKLESNRENAQQSSEQNQEQINQGTEGDTTADSTPTSAVPNQTIDHTDIDRIFQPFNAGGIKGFQVRNVDEAISLMQKGVDYTRKQQALKPRLAEMRTLEQNGLLGDNLNYVIDLYQGRPEAVAKLIRDKGIDINSLMPSTNEFGETQENTTPYVPNNHKLSEEQVLLTDVLDTLRENNTYDQVNTAVEKFDQASRLEFTKDPNKLLALESQIKSGLFDQIMEEVQHQRIIDNPAIRGKSDFEVYSEIGASFLQYYYQQLQQQQQTQTQTQTQVNQQQQQQVQAPVMQQQYQPVNPNYQQQQQQIQDRKASVAPNRPTATTGNRVTDFDPLYMSDKELESIDLRKFGGIKLF